MLKVENLSVEIDGRKILENINLEIAAGEVEVLFGPNGSGKTTLICTIMGFPQYKVTKGAIYLDGKDITGLPMDERARLGVGMAFQRPPAVRGVSMTDIVQMICEANKVCADADTLAGELELTNLLERDVNLGFSGGEIKRSELLQLMAQEPRVLLFDEPESGVDLVNIALVGRAMNKLLHKDGRSPHEASGLIITHTGHILDYVNADRGCVLMRGGIHCGGNPRDLLEHIRTKGYEGCEICESGG